LSTRGNVIRLAKKHQLLAIQRRFLLDSQALEQNLKFVYRFQPACIEVLPGVIPTDITQIQKDTDTQIIAGGLVREKEEGTSALQAGAVAVSTSNSELW